jgi:hypothetical protein
MKVVVLSSQSGDWEGLFIDGVLIDEGHELGDGYRFYWMQKSEQYGFKWVDISDEIVNDEDEEYLCDIGNFPKFLHDLKGNY